MLAACTVLNPGFLASYWSVGLVDFFRICANFTPRPEENDQYSVIQASSQSTFINEQLYCIIEVSACFCTHSSSCIKILDV
jgi:hypothetical protein